MTLHLPPSPSAEDADLAAAELIEELASRLQAGEAIDLEACARAHPECADRIRRLLPAVQMLAELGRSSAGVKVTTGTAEPLRGVLGDFRLRREVGRGGMGIVYEAEQISLQRRVALKVLPFAAMLDPRQLQRFHNEARAAACLHHPNIVPVYAVSTDRAIHYYAMQFIDGQTLAALILGLRQQAGIEPGGRKPIATSRSLFSLQPAGQRSAARNGSADAQPTLVGSVPSPAQSTSVAGAAVTPTVTSTGRGTRAPSFFRRVAQLGVQAAEALEHAHQQGVIHRDIKPGNILLDTRGNLWITDFGLAQFQHEAGMTATGDLLGTLRYMSPENARGGRRVADHRVDIYSLGLTLYELLTLEPAFPGDNREELIRRITTDEPRPVRRLDPAVPLDLETIVAKAMAKNPEERYPTAQEMADDLKRFLEDRPIRARRPTLLQQGNKWARRNRPYVWSLGLFLALAVLASVVGSLVYAITEGHLADKEKHNRENLEVEQRALAVKHFDALLGTAHGRRLEREPGYRQRVWDDLHEAVDLHVPNRNSDLIRDRFLACLGDPIGLEPVTRPTAARAGRPEVSQAWHQWLDGLGWPAKSPRAISPNGMRLAYVFSNYPAWLWVQVPAKPWERSLERSLLGASTFGLAAAPLGQAPLLTSSGLLPRQTNGWGYWYCPLGGINDLEFGPDNHTLVAGCDEGVVVWTLDDPMSPSVPLLLRSQFKVGNIWSVAIHPGGRLLAIGGRQVELWSLDANSRIATVGTLDRGTKVAFSQDGKLLLAKVKSVEMGWPVTETPEKRLLQVRQGGVPVIAFSPDGKLLAWGSKDGVARIWDIARERVVHTCRGSHLPSTIGAGFDNTVEGLAFSPDGKWLATGDWQGAVCVWDVASGREVAVVGSWRGDGPGQVWRLEFSPSGKYLVAAGMNGVVVWKLRPTERGLTVERVGSATPPNAPNVPWPRGTRDVAIHPNEKEIVFLNASGAGGLYAAKLEGNSKPRQIFDRSIGAYTALRGLNFDAAGEHLTYITANGTLGVWDWRASNPTTTNVHANHLALGGGGRWIAAASPAHEVVLYDVKLGHLTMTLPPEESEIWGLAWSPDGTHLAVGMTDGGIAIWDLERVRQSLAEFGLVVPSTASPVRR
jgi:serine/threonine protein kinase/WD40 repeat protein